MNKKSPTIISIYPLPFDIQFRHEANISIFHKGKYFAYEEAKLVEDKEYASSIFPDKSFFAGLFELGLKPDQVDLWIFPSPSNDFNFESLYKLFNYYKALPSVVDSYLSFEDWSKQHIIFIDHHDMHAGLGYLLINKDSYISVTQDGGGDFGDPHDLVIHLYSVLEHKRIFKTKNYFNAPNFHAGIAEILSFRENGKVSGLAAYGKNNKDILKILSSEVTKKEEFLIFQKKRTKRTNPKINRLNFDSFDKYKLLNPSPGHLELRNKLKGFMPQDIACTSEKFISKTYLEYLENILKKKTFPFLQGTITNSSLPIFFSGGLFNNVILNREIISLFGETNKCYFGMAPGDCGLSLGGIGHYLNSVNNSKSDKIIIDSPLLGPSFSCDLVKKFLDETHLNYKSFDSFQETCFETAKLISEDKIVGFFQGRAEYGPRSLGARSIIADPRKSSSKARLNQLAKKRDWFMPFAPAILDTHINDYVIDPKFPNYYMQVASYMKEKAFKEIPAAVHFDGTSRVQKVSKKSSPKFFNLIKEFYNQTKVPCLLNTSFNRHGISTIATPRQAIEHLLFSHIDCLVINNFVISREENLKDNFSYNINNIKTELDQINDLLPLK